MEKERTSEVPAFLLRSAIIHSLTYFVAGMIAASLLDYRRFFQEPVIREYMLGFGSSSGSLGPWLQPLRGLLFGLVLLPFRGFLAERKAGWLYLWGIFLGIGILGTPAAAPSSIEGLLYSRIPLWYHLAGLPEVSLQTLAYSWILHLYLRHPRGIVRDLPPVFGSLLAALAGACFAFVGYAAFSIAFALAAGLGTGSLEGSLSLKTQGLFIAPLLLNAALIFASGRRASREASSFKRLTVMIAAYASNAVAIFLYQALVMGGTSLGYILLAPVLPALITGLVARQVIGPKAGH